MRTETITLYGRDPQTIDAFFDQLQREHTTQSKVRVEPQRLPAPSRIVAALGFGAIGFSVLAFFLGARDLIKYAVALMQGLFR